MKPKRTGTGPQEVVSDQDDVPTLPVWKAFVVQFSRETKAHSGTFSGRVEHISSGCRARFASTEELLAALGKMLDDLDETRA